MNKQQIAASRLLTFRRWTRRNYAVFASLGRQIRIGVLCLCCSLLITRAFATEITDTIPSKEIHKEHDLEEVVVSASHAPAVSSEVMRLVHLISRTDIEASPASDLASLLAGIRGIDIRARGSYGMQADIGIRGGTFDQTLVLLNGVNISDPQTGHHHLNVPVDLQSIERIEILQGPGARVFGPNAFNGVVNIITRNPAEHGMGLSLAGGAYGFGSTSVSAAFNALKTDHHLSAHAMRSDGYTDNTDFESINLYYRGATRIGSYKLDIQGGYTNRAFGANSFYTPLFPDQFEQISTTLISVGLFPKEQGFRFQSYWRRHHDRFELFRYNAPEWYQSHNYHMSDVAGGRLSKTLTSNIGLTTVALDFRHEQIYSNVLGETIDPHVAVARYENVFYTHFYSRQGLSLMAEHNIYAGDFSLSGGLLAYASSDLASGISLFPGLDIGWQFNETFRWYTSLNRTLRLPTFTDLFYEGPANLGNPDLLPEKAIFFETGLKGNVRNLYVEFGVYHRWGSDMIDWVRYLETEKWNSMNHTKVNIAGFEFGLSFHPLSLQYSFNYATSDSGELISNYALDHLRHTLDLRFQYLVSKQLSTTVLLSWRDRAGSYMHYEQDQYSELRPFPSYWTTDVRLSYALENITIFAEASNLFNTHIVSHANVPQPGRWLRAGISYNTFGK